MTPRSWNHCQEPSSNPDVALWNEGRKKKSKSGGSGESVWGHGEAVDPSLLGLPTRHPAVLPPPDKPPAGSQPAPVRETTWELVGDGPWQHVTMPDGNQYYYNQETKESAWELPAEELFEIPDDDDPDDDSEAIGNGAEAGNEAPYEAPVAAGAGGEGGAQ